MLAWGAGTNGSGSSSDYGQAMVPVGLSNVVAIAAGTYHSLALRANGTVVAWGAGIINGDPPHRGQSVVPAGLTNVVAIAGNSDYSFALRRDGAVVVWGGGYGASVSAGSNTVAIAARSDWGLFLQADGTVIGGRVPPHSLADVLAISAGAAHGLALKADGTLAAWDQWDGEYQTNVPAGLEPVMHFQ